MDVEDIDDIVARFNQELERIGDDRRFVSIEGNCDFSTWMLLRPDMFKKLFLDLPAVFELEQIPAVDQAKWAV